MRFTTSLLTVALTLIPSCLAASPAAWRGRAIYQVLTDRFARADGSTTATCDTGVGQYCGGSWQGIINRLDYIQGMGFDAVWISPVTKNIEGQTAYGNAYHGYWQTDIGSVNQHFGSASDLKALSSALHARGMVSRVDRIRQDCFLVECRLTLITVPDGRHRCQPQWFQRRRQLD